MYARAMLIGRAVKEETPYTFEDGSKVLEFLPYQRSTDNANFPGEIILEMFKK